MVQNSPVRATSYLLLSWKHTKLFRTIRALPSQPFTQFHPITPQLLQSVNANREWRASEVVDMWFLSNSVPPTLQPVVVPLFARYEVSHTSGPILHMQALPPPCTNPQHDTVTAPHKHCPFQSQMFWPQKSYSAHVCKDTLTSLIVCLKSTSPSQHISNPSRYCILASQNKRKMIWRGRASLFLEL